MTMSRQNVARSGFTLLEVLLAFSLSVLLMAALYVAMETQLRMMDEGRAKVEQATLGRAVVARIATDFTTSLGPIVPLATSSSSSSMTTTTPGAGPATSEPASQPATSTSDAVTFQVGVKGDSTSCSVFHTRMTRGLITPTIDASGNEPPPAADIRRITYFLAGSGGLARQELKQPTAEAVDEMPSDVDEFSQILATEVQDLSFRYFDGTTWQDSWDGSEAGPDGQTPKGPPRAIELTVVIQVSDQDRPRTYRHVIALPTAPGPATATSGNTTTTTPP